MPTITPAEAAAIAKRGRRLLRAGRITHRQFVVLDCLLWSCRSPTTGAIVVSYTALQRLTRMARATIAGALAMLERLRVLSRIKRRIVVAWHQGGQQSRQATSCYVLHHEFSGCTVSQNDRTEILYVAQSVAPGVIAAARAALAARARAVEGKLLLNKGVGLAGAF